MRAANASASHIIDLWQLHRIDSKVPRGEQFAAIKSLLDDKVIRHAGLSEVSVAEIEAANKVFKVATVQNRYNLTDRASEDVLTYCEKHDIGFIPWYPLAAGDLSGAGSALDEIAQAHSATRRPDRVGVAAEAQPGDVADPRHFEGRAPRARTSPRRRFRSAPTSLRRSTAQGAANKRRRSERRSVQICRQRRVSGPSLP